MEKITYVFASVSSAGGMAVLLYLLLINGAAFAAYGLDKRAARLDQWRISEKTLLLLAALGGSLGAALGMRIFHHKTKKAKFFLLVPVFLAVHAALLIWWLF